MANLLDTIRGNTGALGSQQQGVTDQSASLQQLLRAKSGKAVGGPDVSSSNLGEQQAVAQTNQQIQGQIAPQAQIQQAGLQQQAAGQQQQQNIATGQIAQQRKFDTMQNRLQTNEILSDLERNRGQIDLAKDQARMEQLGFQLRLQDTKYLDNLQREGARQRLDNDMQFKQELATSVLGDNKQLLEKELGNKSLLDVNARDFNKSMANMDVGTAYDMFKNEMSTARDRQMWSSTGALGSAAVAGYGTYQEGQDKKAYYGKGGAGSNIESFEASQARK